MGNYKSQGDNKYMEFSYANRKKSPYAGQVFDDSDMINDKDELATIKRYIMWCAIVTIPINLLTIYFTVIPLFFLDIILGLTVLCAIATYTNLTRERLPDAIGIYFIGCLFNISIDLYIWIYHLLLN